MLRSHLSVPRGPGSPRAPAQTGNWTPAQEVCCGAPLPEGVSLGGMGRGTCGSTAGHASSAVLGCGGEGLVVCTAVTAPRSQVGPRQLCPGSGVGSFRGSPGGVCAGRWGRARGPRDHCVTRRQKDAFSWAGVTCRGTQVGLDFHLRFITTVATWATETFVLSLKLVKSYDLGIAEMCASPTFKCLLCL